jgi:peptide deformylase
MVYFNLMLNLINEIKRGSFLMILPIIQYGNPILRKKALTIKEFNPSIKELAQNMIETMIDAKGVGIAAPQVGESLALFVIDKQFASQEPGFLIVANPTLTPIGENFIINEEGCLSIPGINANVRRHQKVHLKAQDENGKPFELEANDYLAIVMQHEYDHLIGVLFTDKVLVREKNFVEKCLMEFKKSHA